MEIFSDFTPYDGTIFCSILESTCDVNQLSYVSQDSCSLHEDNEEGYAFDNDDISIQSDDGVDSLLHESPFYRDFDEEIKEHENEASCHED